MDDKRFVNEDEHQYYRLREAQKQYWNTDDPNIRAILLKIINDAESKLKASKDPMYVEIANAVSGGEKKSTAGNKGGSIIKKLIIGLGIAAVLAGCVFLLIVNVIQPAQKKSQADKLFVAGDYEGCYNILREMGETAAVNEYKQKEVTAHYQSYEYDKAYAVLDELHSSGVLNDADYTAKMNDGLYKQAQHYYVQKQYQEAYDIYITLGDYSSSASQAQKCLDALAEQGDEATEDETTETETTVTETNAEETTEAETTEEETTEAETTEEETTEEETTAEETTEEVTTEEVTTEATTEVPATEEPVTVAPTVAPTTLAPETTAVPVSYDLTGKWSNAGSSAKFADTMVITGNKLTVTIDGEEQNYTFSIKGNTVSYGGADGIGSFVITNMNGSSLQIALPDGTVENFIG